MAAVATAGMASWQRKRRARQMAWRWAWGVEGVGEGGWMEGRRGWGAGHGEV